MNETRHRHGVPAGQSGPASGLSSRTDPSREPDVRTLLHLLKLGGVLNLWFLWQTWAGDLAALPPAILLPGRILFAVSAWRCFFPNRYEGNIVLHDTPLSSALLTRILATFAEVAWIGQFAFLLHTFNASGLAWVDAIVFYTIVQVVVSQAFVWAALLTGRRSLYVWEELGWFLMFLGNTAASIRLSLDDGQGEGPALLLTLNILFGVLYLPWQVFHLRALLGSARAGERQAGDESPAISPRILSLWRDTQPSTRAASWGGTIGICWMLAYWALLIPPWIFVVMNTLAG